MPHPPKKKRNALLLQFVAAEPSLSSTSIASILSTRIISNAQLRAGQRQNGGNNHASNDPNHRSSDSNAARSYNQ
jgi:hypothetical protein